MLRKISVITVISIFICLFLLPSCDAFDGESENPVGVNTNTSGENESSDSSLVMIDPETHKPVGWLSYCPWFSVPWLPQVPPGDWDNTRNCGQAVAVMLGGYFNHGRVSSDIITMENNWLAGHLGDSRFRNPNGWYTGRNNAEPLRELLWHFHALEAPCYYGNGVDDVIAELYRGRPVIVCVKTDMKTYGDSHWMLCIGYDKTYLYFNDPGHSYRSNYGGYCFRYTVSRFNRSWRTEDRQYLPVWRR